MSVEEGEMLLLWCCTPMSRGEKYQVFISTLLVVTSVSSVTNIIMIIRSIILSTVLAIVSSGKCFNMKLCSSAPLLIFDYR